MDLVTEVKMLNGPEQLSHQRGRLRNTNSQVVFFFFFCQASLTNPKTPIRDEPVRALVCFMALGHDSLPVIQHIWMILLNALWEKLCFMAGLGASSWSCLVLLYNPHFKKSCDAVQNVTSKCNTAQLLQLGCIGLWFRLMRQISPSFSASA